MLLSELQQYKIKEMLKNDVPIPIIKERLGLLDADYIYEIIYKESIENRITKSNKKCFKTNSYRKTYNEYDLVLKLIEKYHKELNKSMQIIDLGCGDGSFTYKLSKALKNFSSCS